MRSNSDSIRDVLNGMRPRVQTLQSGAAGGASSPLLHNALDELHMAMEELQVSEEELRVQAESMAEQQLSLEGELARYRDLFRLSPEPRLVTDTEGMIVDGNEAAVRLLRPGPRDLPGRPLALFVAEEDRRAFRGMVRRLGHGEVVEDTLRLSPADSLPVDVEVSATARSRTRGGPVELHWTLRDVTARRVAGAVADDAAELRRMVVESAPVPLVAMDLDGSVLLWNAAAAGLLGWTEEEVLGRRNPALAREEVSRAREAAEAGEPASRLAVAHRADGSPLPVSLHQAPLAGADGSVRGLVVALREPDGEEGEAAPSAYAAPRQETARPGWTRNESLQVLRCAAGSDGGDVVRRLRNWIASGLHLGYLHPDDRLPSIREVSQECAVDHRAVSAAYRALAAEGVVEVRSRHGVYVAATPPTAQTELSETAEWLAGVLGDAGALQLKVPMLPDLVRDWTASTRVACACVDDTEDGLVALTTELRQQWGLDTYPVPQGAARNGRWDEAALVAELRRADVVVTTAFHAGAVGAVAASLGKPMVVLRANPELVETLEERVASRPLTVVVADAAYGERLACVRGARDRVQVVPVSDAAALAALDPAEPVLVTRAAQQRLGSVRARLLYPLSPVFCPTSARDLAAVLIRTNIRAGRKPA